MLINNFNPSAFMRAPQVYKPQEDSNALENRRIQNKTYTNPNYQDQNASPSVFPEFQANTRFTPLADSLSGLGTGLATSVNKGFSKLNQFSLNMPTLNMPQPVYRPQKVVQPPALDRTPSVRPTTRQIFNSIGQGASQGLKDFGKLAKQHAPTVLTFGAALAGGGAVCPFMGGAMAATGGIMLAQQGANNQAA